jgi:hypothetical protein
MTSYNWRNTNMAKTVEMTNRDFAKTKGFVEACVKAGIEPTTRQASKYRRKMGVAYVTGS